MHITISKQVAEPPYILHEHGTNVVRTWYEQNHMQHANVFYLFAYKNIIITVVWLLLCKTQQITLAIEDLAT